MKFEGSGSKDTRVIERKRSVTDGQTARRTDGQSKNNMSPPEGGGHNKAYYKIAVPPTFCNCSRKEIIGSLF